MESVGDYEYSHKELIGHGAFAVVFKGRLRKNPNFIVAIKSITKKNLAKSQNLLGKEIKILKELTELHHENVVALYDCKETPLNVFLVMEYCNGGDLADYLSNKGTLSEDTIRLFLYQMAGAMKALYAKGIVHRDLKPQNILLSYADDKSKESVRPQDIKLKIADFGFARFLQDGVMAATLCGSPMYMAPEVIMSLQYDAKADLWSIGTIVFQCLTGRAPFQATSPQALKQFYEKNANLAPKIPSGTSQELTDLLMGLLRRNARDRMPFDKFFNHPFLQRQPEVIPNIIDFPASTPKTITIGSSTPPKITPLAQRRAVIAKPVSRTPPSPCSPQLRRAGSSSPEETDDFVMVPENLPSHPPLPEHLDRISAKINARNSIALATSPPRPSFLPISEPIPVPTQRDVYQQLHSNEGLPSPKSSIPRSQPISMKRGSEREHTRTTGPPDIGSLSPPSVQFMIGTPPGGQTRRRSASGSSCETPPPVTTWTVSPVSAGKITPTCSPLKRSGTSSPLLSGPLSMLPNLISENNNLKQSPLIPFGTRAMTLPEISEAGGFRGFIPDTPPLNIEGPITFLAPELPEETLLEREHNETLAKLNFVVALSDCVFEIALSRNPSGPLSAILTQDNAISNEEGVSSTGFSNESTKRAEKLVLVYRAMQLLISGLNLAVKQLNSGQLRKSTSVKNVMSVMHKRLCKCLNECKQLYTPGLVQRAGKCNITAEKILYQHAINMCQQAALDELFGNTDQCFQRYQTAQILLHSLSQQVHHHDDRDLLKKYKDAVEKRLFVLQQHGFIYST